jgi:NTE family protein
MKIGLALGSGAARGWAHVGVLRALEELGIVPDIVCGTSIGAVVGAACLTSRLNEFVGWGQNLGLMGVLEIIGSLDVTFRRGGLVMAERPFRRLLNIDADVMIEDLATPFAAVATDLATGREVWLRDGPLLEAVRASAAMPGLFPGVHRDGQWLVDGALVNPVPVSVCRAMGADVVIAVNLNGDLGPARLAPRAAGDALTSLVAQTASQIGTQIAARLGLRPGEPGGLSSAAMPPNPNLLEMVAGSVDIMQDRITRSRLAGDPPDVLIAPRVGQIGILQFDRTGEAVDQGYAAAMAMRPALDMALSRG